MAMFTKIYARTDAPAGNCGGTDALYTGTWQGSQQFLLRSLPGAVSPDEILKRLFSSSLPPSFASGRFAAFLFPAARWHHA